MCGIAGIYHFGERERPVDRDLLGAMTDVLSHRGPDDSGIYIAGNLGLSQRRLSIVDLSPAGRNPMPNEDDSLWITFNGEVYNVRDRRSELEARGHRIRSHTDTEMLLHLYEEKGLEFVHELRGMFAFALWDAPRRTLIVVRDRLGIKPLYWRADRGTFAFASELKALLADPECPRNVSLEALDDYLAYQYVPSPASILEGVRKLPPGHLLIVTPDGVEERRYWAPPTEVDRTLSFDAAAERLRSLLEEAVRLRLMSDVPIGAFLSGGIDSSIVCALMARAVGGRIRTFTIGFEGAPEDETVHARRVARHIGSEHHEFVVKPDALTILPGLVWHLDEPLADVSTLPTWAVSEMARQHVTVALSGDGGDETHAGYETYRWARAYARLDAIPGPLRRLAARLGRGAPPKLRRRLDRLGRAPLERFLDVMTLSAAAERRVLFASDHQDKLDGRDALDWARARVPAGARDAVSALPGLDLGTYLPDDVLAKVDRMSMAHALEVRVPLLDHRVVEFTSRLPFEYKLRGNTSKALLKAATADLLPPEILARGKQGFAVPLARWFGGSMDGLVRDVLAAPALARRGILDPRAVDAVVARALGPQRDPRAARILWALLVFELWATVLLDHGPAAPAARPRLVAREQRAGVAA